jgi:hypothetical protein
MSTLRKAIVDYLNERRAKGHKLRAAGYALLRFASFMEKRGKSYITARLALEWVEQSDASKPATRAGYMDYVRQFARYRSKTDPRTEIPPYGMAPHPPRGVGSRTSPKEARSGLSPNSLAASNSAQGLLASAREYVYMRRTLGFKYERAGAALINFATFMQGRGADYVTTQLALEWAQSPPNSKPATWAQRLSIVRLFAQHRSTVDPRTEIPPWGLLPHSPKRRANPYFYTDAEIEQLLDASLNVRVYNSGGLLKRQTYYCFFGLLAAMPFT